MKRAGVCMAILVSALSLGPSTPSLALQTEGVAPSMPPRSELRPVAGFVVGGTAEPVLSRVEVGNLDSGAFLVRLNNKPVLERAVAKSDREGSGPIELGALFLKEGDRLELLAAGDAAGGSASLRAIPYPTAEADRDRTAELRTRNMLVFQDDFDGPEALAQGIWGKDGQRGYIHPSSPETVYSSQSFSRAARLGERLDPFTLHEGILSIKAGEIPRSGKSNVCDALGDRLKDPTQLKYYSGSMSSRTTWSQTYGYFEMRAKLPRGEGFWPAFWLTSTIGWPPEIDILEAIYHAQTGVGVNRIHSGLHFKRLGPNRKPIGKRLVLSLNTPNPTPISLYDDFHLYASEWTPEWISIFFDGRLIYKVATPAQMHQPMYLVANLQVGTRNPQPNWGAHLADVRDLANSMDIDFIASYRSPDAYPVVLPAADGSLLAPEQPGAAVGFRVEGDDRPNRIMTSRGLDVIRTGGGGDTVVISGAQDANKIIEDFNPSDGDRLELSGFPWRSTAEALENARQQGPDVWLIAGPQPVAPQTIILKNLSLAELGSSAIWISDRADPIAPAFRDRSGGPGRERPKRRFKPPFFSPCR